MPGTRTKESKPSAKPALAARRRRRGIFRGAFFIAVVTILAYLPAIRGGFIWDDPDYVVNNPTLRDASGLVQMWTDPQSLPQWYPLVHTTFWIEYHLWQLWPTGYHIDNVILHIVSAMLLWRLLVRLEVPGAWLAAAIFALHPVEVESVSWVTERKNVLSCALALSSLLVYLRFLDQPKRQWGIYALSLLLFLAALFSKTVVATLPAVILVILWWKNGKIRIKDLLPLVPYFIVGISLGLFTAYLEKYHVGASGERIAELNFTLAERVLIAGRVVWFYAYKLLVPWPLVFIYPRWNLDPRAWWQWIFPVAAVLSILLLILNQRRIGRGPVAAILIFCGVLFPVLGFVNFYPMRFSFVADHFQYHASIALIALFAAGLCRYAGKYGRLVLIPLAVLTILRTPVYTDAQTLWEDTLARNPDSWMVQMNLAHALEKQSEATGDFMVRSEAEAHYLRSAELASNYETETYAGFVYDRRGNPEEAIRHFETALRFNPQYVPAWFGIGQVYERQHKFDDALRNYEKALEIAPRYARANYRIARILVERGEPIEAAERYRRAVAANPNDPDYRYDLGTLLITLGQFDEAAANLLAAAHLRPDWPEAWTNLGAAQLKAGHRADAVQSFRRALSIRPGFPPAEMGLQQAMKP